MFLTVTLSVDSNDFVPYPLSNGVQGSRRVVAPKTWPWWWRRRCTEYAYHAQCFAELLNSCL